MTHANCTSIEGQNQHLDMSQAEAPKFSPFWPILIHIRDSEASKAHVVLWVDFVKGGKKDLCLI